MHMALACLISIAGTTIYDQPPAALDRYLAELHARTPSFLERFNTVVRDSVGTPYHDGPLGEGEGAPYDSDPIIDLGRVDCVTFVEQSAALAQAADYAQVTDALQRIRYQGGRIDFARRNHFMIADWVPNNAWCREITADLGLPTRPVTRTISKAEFFKRVKAPELGQDIPDRKVTVACIPIENAAALADSLDKPALIVFIGHVEWLFALHCGIYLPDDQGGALYHASARAGQVVAMDLGAYAAEQSRRYLGMAVYEISASGPSQTEN